MPSSSTGIERSVSPSPRSRSIPQDPTSSRYRPSTTTTAQYNTPELGNVMHSLHHRPSPHHNPYNPVVAANGYVTSSSDPRRAGSGEATLSNTLTNLYRSAVSSFAPSSSSSSSSSSQYQPFTNLEPSPSSLSPRIASTTTTGTARRKRGGGEPASSSLRLTVPAPSTVGFVALCCLWYLSSALSSNTGKSILTRFRYPVTLTFVQFAFVAWYSLVVLVVRARIAHWRITTTNNSPSTTKGGQRRRSSFGQAAETAINNTLRGWGVRKPTRSMFHGTFTMSLFQIAGHVFSSMAIARVPVSTVHTIKALSPLFTVLSYVALFGVRYSTRTYLSLFPLTVGVMLACSFDLRANAIGFLCALGSTFIFVAQNIFSKKLLPKESSAATSGGGGGGGGGETLSTSNSKGTSGGGGGGGGHGAKLDKMNLLFYSSGMAFFLMIPIWLYSDATSLFWSPATSQQQQVVDPTNTTASLVFYFFLNGTVHFGQNLLAFSLLARTSPVTYSIASLVKRIAVICIAIVWFGQPVKLVQGFGMTMTFAGLYLYNQSKASVDKGEQRRVMVEKKRGLELPTSLDDARAMDSVESSSAEDDDSNGKLETTTNGGVYNYGHHQQHVPPPPMSSSSMTNAYHPAGPPPLPPPPPRISFEQKHQPPASASVVTSTTNNVSHEQRGQLSRNRQTSLPTTTTLPPPASSKPSSSSPSSHTTLYSPPPPPLNHDSHSSKFVAPPPPPPPSSSSSASAAISISAPPTHQSPRYHPDSHLFSQAPPPPPLPLSTSSTTPIANGYR